MKNVRAILSAWVALLVLLALTIAASLPLPAPDAVSYTHSAVPVGSTLLTSLPSASYVIVVVCCRASV